MKSRSRHGNLPLFWVVICPELRVKGGIWRRWFREGYVAIGWPPSGHCEPKDEPGYSLEGASRNRTWSRIRNCLRDMREGDKIIPFLMDWRIGPVGTIQSLHITDAEWNPTVREEEYVVGEGDDMHLSPVPELGRRITVEWETQGMPPGGQVARVPRLPDPERIARYTTEWLSDQKYNERVNALRNRSSWEPVERANIFLGDHLL